MKEILEKYRNPNLDLSCSETILYSFNEKYGLNLSEESFKMMAPFSGGMYEGETCGIMTAGLSVLGIMFTNNVSHQSPVLHQVVLEFKSKFRKQFQSTICSELVGYKRKEDTGCTDFIVEGGLLLDEVISKYVKS